MKQSKQATQPQPYDGLQSTGETDKSLYTRKEMPGTPFLKISGENKWFLTIGDVIIAPPQPSEEALHEYMQENMYMIMFQMAIYVQSKAEEIKAQDYFQTKTPTISTSL